MTHGLVSITFKGAHLIQVKIKKERQTQDCWLPNTDNKYSICMSDKLGL